MEEEVRENDRKYKWGGSESRKKNKRRQGDKVKIQEKRDEGRKKVSKIGKKKEGRERKEKSEGVTRRKKTKGKR